MAVIASYTGGVVPRIGDFVRSTHPDGPRHGMYVVGIVPSGLRVVEDVTGRVREIPARNLDLVHRIAAVAS
jgi:hypothetical protein